MKFERVELRHIRLEMARPFETSFGRQTHRDLVILRVESDVGSTYAEAPSLAAPIYSDETTETTIHVLRDFLIPAVLGKDFDSPEGLHHAMGFVRGHPIAKSGLDTAWYHLAAASANKSLSAYLGGTRGEVAAGISVGIEADIDALVKYVARWVHLGYRRIKIKIKPGWDIEPVTAIREEFGDIPLMVDANSAYELKHLDILKSLDQFHLMMIEQPLGYDDIYQHSVLQRQIETPICLDESIQNVADAEAAVNFGACKIINIKLSRVGGLFPSVRIHDICREHGIPVWCGGMFESALGKSDCVALASLSNFTYPADIAPSDRYFKRDLVGQFIKVEQGNISVSNAVGLGFELDEDFLEKCTLKKFECS